MRCRSFRLLLLGDVYEPRVKRGAIRPAWLSPPSMPEEQALTGELTRGGGGDRECWWQDLPARRVCTKPCDGAGPRGGGGAVRQGHGPVAGRGARLLPQRGGVTWAGDAGARRGRMAGRRGLIVAPAPPPASQLPAGSRAPGQPATLAAPASTTSMLLGNDIFLQNPYLFPIGSPRLGHPCEV